VAQVLPLVPEQWFNFGIEYPLFGSSQVMLAGSQPKLQDINISTSHDGDYAMVFADAIL
jgi:hypothetical protein